jgi:hypothetical protein
MRRNKMRIFNRNPPHDDEPIRGGFHTLFFDQTRYRGHFLRQAFLRRLSPDVAIGRVSAATTVLVPPI